MNATTFIEGQFGSCRREFPVLFLSATTLTKDQFLMLSLVGGGQQRSRGLPVNVVNVKYVGLRSRDPYSEHVLPFISADLITAS